MSLKKNEKASLKATEKMLKKQEKVLLSAYKKSLNDIRLNVSRYYEKYAVKGILPASKAIRVKQLNALLANVQTEIKTLQGAEFVTIHNHLGEVYKSSYYRAGHALETEVGGDLGFSLLNTKTVEAAALDTGNKIKWSKSSKKNSAVLNKRVKNIITQGVIKGDSLQKVNRSIKDQMGIGASKSMRIARTETGRAQSEGQVKAYNEAESEGLVIQRIWIASLDARTRDSHAETDKQIADKNNLFTLGSGVVTEAPHMSGIAEEDINCRCDIAAQLPGTESEQDFRAVRDPESGDTVNIKNMSFNEWSKLKKVA